MDELELDKASQRANLIEQRMFEITLSSIDTLKHATAIELHKSQNEMKKRLRKYRDRQREIVRNRPGFDKDPIDELIARQLQNKAKAKQSARSKRNTSTPAGSPISPRTPRSSRVSTREKSTVISEFDSDSESDFEIDSSFMIDQQRSKIDLRPKTAMDIVRKGTPFESYINYGRLGPPVRQIRYFDDDELKDREHFYKHLVEKRIVKEKTNIDTLDDKVAKFCGNETIQTMMKKIQSKRKMFTRSTAELENMPVVKSDQRQLMHSQDRPRSRRRPNTSVGTRREL